MNGSDSSWRRRCGRMEMKKDDVREGREEGGRGEGCGWDKDREEEKERGRKRRHRDNRCLRAMKTNSKKRFVEKFRLKLLFQMAINA